MAFITINKNPTGLSGTIRQIGENAPNFLGIDQNLKEKHLSEFIGKKTLLNFVTSVDDPICARSIRAFNQIFSPLDINVLCVSLDLPFALSRFIKKENIKHALLLSLFREDSFFKNYGTKITEGSHQGMMAQSVYILDEKGIIYYSELVMDFQQEPDYNAIADAI